MANFCHCIKYLIQVSVFRSEEKETYKGWKMSNLGPAYPPPPRQMEGYYTEGYSMPPPDQLGPQAKKPRMGANGGQAYGQQAGKYLDNFWRVWCMAQFSGFG